MAAPKPLPANTVKDPANELVQDRLLSALTECIRPIVQLCVPLQAPQLFSVGSKDIPSVRQNLLSALKEFIEVTTRSMYMEIECQNNVYILDNAKVQAIPHLSLVGPSDEPRTPLERSTDSMIRIPRGIQNQAELSPRTMEVLRKRVFNDMPIRLLAFNSDGSEVELIERNEILRRCACSLQKRIGTYKDTKHRVEAHTKYAILSHTWIRDTPGDVVYREWDTRHLNERGYNKIEKFCHIASQDYGVNLGWMDTVCINKDSSSELDESIRSTYKWYRNATICVAYLSETSVLGNMHSDSWFTRGWTLQELLGPSCIHFYNSNWKHLTGTITRLEESATVRSGIENMDIAAQITKATTITHKELNFFRYGRPDMVPISRRMQLAAKRKVTREEDSAYSLMGIFGVDIPIAYGEGRQRAFFRLVRELMGSQTHFIDLFNCGHSPNSNGPTRLIASDVDQYLGRSYAFDHLGSSSPFDYLYSNAGDLGNFKPIEPVILTHLGIRIPLLLVPGILRLSINPSFEQTSRQERSGRRSRLMPNSESGYDTTDRDDPSKSLGSFYGTVDVQQPGTEKHPQEILTYHLLHQNISRPQTQYDDILIITPHSLESETVVFGIINFGIDDDIISLPRHCLSIPLDCGSKVWDVSPSDTVSILGSTNAIVFQLESKEKTNMIPRRLLATHGMQLVTLYL